jgi:hypothetical protein
MKKMMILYFLIGSLIFSCSDKASDLREKEEVLNTVNRLFIKTDERDWQAVKECFASKVHFDMSSLAGGELQKLSPQQIVDAWDEGLKGLKAIHHQAGNYVVTLKDNEAEVFCYGIATHYYPNPVGGSVNTFVGSYDFHLLKEGQKWKLDLFKYNVKYIDGNQNIYKLAQENR